MSSPARLFIGNLAPQVDEYTLIQVFSKYGPLAKLDLLYHKAGPQKGQPRGYAFVEFLEPAVGCKHYTDVRTLFLRSPNSTTGCYAADGWWSQTRMPRRWRGGNPRWPRRR